MQIDTLKRRSSLVNMLDPGAVALSMAAKPLDTFEQVGSIARAVFTGNGAVAARGIEKMVHVALNPPKPYSYLYKGGQLLGAAVDGTIGVLEIHQGLKTENRALTVMGVADLIGGTASAVTAAGFPGTALCMTVASAATKTGLIWAMPDKFSKVQKMKTCFDAANAVAMGMLRAGVAVVPSLSLQAGLGITELLYMNSDTFQKSVDRLF